MEGIHVNSTHSTPEIKYNSESRELWIKGRSIPEDAPAFYKPMFHWLDEHLAQKPNKLIINFELEYFNTASTKVLVDLLSLVFDYKEKDQDVEINWRYYVYDDDMKEVAMQLMEITGLEMNVHELDD